MGNLFAISGAGGAGLGNERSCVNGLDLAEVKSILMSIPAVDKISSIVQPSQ